MTVFQATVDKILMSDPATEEEVNAFKLIKDDSKWIKKKSCADDVPVKIRIISKVNQLMILVSISHSRYSYLRKDRRWIDLRYLLKCYDLVE